MSNYKGRKALDSASLLNLIILTFQKKVINVTRTGNACSRSNKLINQWDLALKKTLISKSTISAVLNRPIRWQSWEGYEVITSNGIDLFIRSSRCDPWDLHRCIVKTGRTAQISSTPPSEKRIFHVINIKKKKGKKNLILIRV